MVCLLAHKVGVCINQCTSPPHYFRIFFSYCRKDFNVGVLKEFISLQDFTKKSLVDALRYTKVVKSQ